MRISFVAFCRSCVGAGSLAASLFLVAAQPVAADSQRRAQTGSSRFQTTRTFELDAGHAVRTFRFRERSGVILVNRLTVPHGVRAFVDARIPHPRRGTSLKLAEPRRPRALLPTTRHL